MLHTIIPKATPVLTLEDIPPSFIDTPFEMLLRFHNLEEDLENIEYLNPELLVIKCMDHRKRLRLPERFAYIVRNAGGNIRSNEFSMSFAIGVGDVAHVAVISHTDCGMVGLDNKKEQFVQGMVKNAGWSRQHAETFYHLKASDFGIFDPVTSAIMEARRFQASYPNVVFQPFLYHVEDGKLYVINDK